MPRFAQTGFSRIFLIANKAGPTHQPTYQGFSAAEALSWKQGDIKPVRFPSPKQRNEFITAGKIRGEQALPQLKIMVRYGLDLSNILKIVRTGCDSDIQIHVGDCGVPTDFLHGWTKIGVLESSVLTDYATDKLGAMDSKERAEVYENVPFDGEDWYEIGTMIWAQQAKAQVDQEVVAISVCDSVQCGLCGVQSDGAQVAFAVQVADSGSPGLPAKVLYTINGGATWGTTHITSSALPSNDDPSDATCVGANLIVLSNEGANLVYAPLADIKNGVDTWTSVATGIVIGGEPNAIFSDGPTLTWVVGNGGYIYNTTDPTSGLTVQDAGVATTQNLNSIHGWDSDNLVAVGNSNAVVYTQNGGQTWSSVTGPNAGQALKCVFMRTQFEWWIGDGAGKMWYTLNSGQSWTQKHFPKETLGSVRDIKFTSPTVGYMTCDDGTKGYILRSIDGGFQWYIAPEGNASMPTCKQFDRLAMTADVNTVFAAGLATGAISGIIVKGQGNYMSTQ